MAQTTATMLRIDPRLLATAKARADEAGISRSELIRRALRSYVGETIV
jgi:predicted HicB family RNase H-like nuclease